MLLPRAAAREYNLSGEILKLLWSHIMLRDLLTQKCEHKKTVTNFRYPRACRFRKTKQTNQFSSPPQPTFFKMWFLIDKIWLKLAKMNWFSNFFANFSHVLSIKNHILKKVGAGGGRKLICLFGFSESACSGVSKISYGFFVHQIGSTSPSAWCVGCLKSVTVFLSTHFWVNKSLSMMWLVNTICLVKYWNCCVVHVLIFHRVMCEERVMHESYQMSLTLQLWKRLFAAAAVA
jgi:hypothetical protein